MFALRLGKPPADQSMDSLAAQYKVTDNPICLFALRQQVGVVFSDLYRLCMVAR